MPPETERVVVGVDLGQYLIHWGAIAFRPGATGHVIDYGRLEVASAELGVERALLVALRELRDHICGPGWLRGEARRSPDAVWIDSGWMTDVAYAFCHESDATYMPTKGYGTSQMQTGYRRPGGRGDRIAKVGEGYHVARVRAAVDHARVRLVEVDADHWKTWLHKRLTTPIGQPGALTLYRAEPNWHLSLAKHLTAERQIEEFDPRRGAVIRWERVGRSNHWLDALYLACAAGHSVGVRLLGPSKPATRDAVPLGSWFASQKRPGRRGR